MRIEHNHVHVGAYYISPDKVDSFSVYRMTMASSVDLARTNSLEPVSMFIQVEVEVFMLHVYRHYKNIVFT